MSRKDTSLRSGKQETPVTEESIGAEQAAAPAPVVEEEPSPTTALSAEFEADSKPAPKKAESKKEPEVVQLNVFQNRIDFIKENGTASEKHVITVLTHYVEVCSISVDLNVIAIEQQRLWRLFEYIHNQPQEFQKLYSLVIEFGREYQEQVFNLAKFFRAQSGLTLSVDQLNTYNNLRTLVLNTVQTKDRSKVKTLIDIRKIVEQDAIPEHIRGAYVAYYN